jgi:hypothetical protein
MAQRGKEKSSEAPISCRRKWNFTVKPRFDLGVFGEGIAADRDIRDFAEVFVWKQTAIENDFPQRVAGCAGHLTKARVALLPSHDGLIDSRRRLANCVLLRSQPRKMAYSYSFSPIFIPAPSMEPAHNPVSP